jgi:hypothetical protein
VSIPINLYGDNKTSIQSAETPEVVLSKKHIAVSYHYVREAVAAKIVNPVWIRTDENFADLCTKSLGKNKFVDFTGDLLF